MDSTGFSPAEATGGSSLVVVLRLLWQSTGFRAQVGFSSCAVVVKLKDPHLFPHKKQYPLKPEVKEGLKLIIENLKEQGLLIPCNSQCNTPILGYTEIKW